MKPAAKTFIQSSFNVFWPTA